MHKLVLTLMRKIGMFKKDETFDPTSFKTKMIFMGSQLVFTVVVSLPTPFLYNAKWASISLAFFVFLCALWNRCVFCACLFSFFHELSVLATTCRGRVQVLPAHP